MAPTRRFTLPKTQKASQAPWQLMAETDFEADRVYLDIRCRVLHGQFLPDQIVDLSAIITHFSTTRSVADRALEALAIDGYLRQTLRGGYVVRRYSPNDVGDMLVLMRRIASAGARSLIREPDAETADQLGMVFEWSTDFQNIDQFKAEVITHKLRWFFGLLMRRATIACAVRPLWMLVSPAVRRHAVRCMTTKDIEVVWGSIHQIASGILKRDATAAQKPLSEPMPYEHCLVTTLTELNALPAAPVVSFAGAAPAFHVLFGNDPDRPCFGLGSREIP